jgi:phospholipase C
MSRIDRRSLLAGATGALAATSAIARAAAIDAHVAAGALEDVGHVVIFMQENRSFDHYFGTLSGVRGFADRLPVPLADAKGRIKATVWLQEGAGGAGRAPVVSPFPLKTTTTFAHMRTEGTPHAWPDAQAAWNEGRLDQWPKAKGDHAMGYFERDDLPFHFALADAFTVCDAYHCAIHAGTNTNRLMLWTGTNDPGGRFGGPAISNSHDNFASLGGAKDPYLWTSYVERLSAAGVSWKIYQDMADNFTDNPLAGFKVFRDAHEGAPGADLDLARRALATRRLDALRDDVVNGRLPEVSYIIAPAAASEHPGPSSPAQGADFTAKVLDALTADPAVWARTVLFLMYDENDGYFDHVPPPAPPGAANGRLLGGSTVATDGEYHLVRNPTEAPFERAALMGRPYGLGPRVPMVVISPWSRGGWVSSEVFDHTSVIRFLEARFGVTEPNISPWRRAVCGDLVSAFDFKTPNGRANWPGLPKTAELARRAAALPGRTVPPTPAAPPPPAQAAGVRPSRPTPYVLNVLESRGADGLKLAFVNQGRSGAVFHVYDRRNLGAAPRRYTVEAGKTLADGFGADAYDLWILGPNGFHRHLVGEAAAGEPLAAVTTLARGPAIVVDLHNPGTGPLVLKVAPLAYAAAIAPWRVRLPAGGSARRTFSLKGTHGWHDLLVTAQEEGAYFRRIAGRVETGRPSVTDPAMAGPAVGRQFSV